MRKFVLIKIKYYFWSVLADDMKSVGKTYW